VRRGVKVIIWIVVFATCAGAGAYVAAHTNPFPPGVEDPGARPTPPTTSPAPTTQLWNLVMYSATRHDLHVGGSCRSGWRTTGVVTIRPDGVARGRALARLKGWSCDFPVAQVQTRLVRLVITGTEATSTTSDGRLVLHFAEAGAAPTGSQDLGGLTATLGQLDPRIELSGRYGNTPAHASRPDGDLGSYVNDSKVQLECATGC
jgi:hypothetical protein